jgi:POT family proton-dependent oligopeptide transporter
MSVPAASTLIGNRAGSATVFGHPRGLIYLAGTELWDRISFHGMQALLVLYMAEQLLLPGHIGRIVGMGDFRALIEGVTGPLSTEALADQIFGLYVGLVALAPLMGGMIGDRLLGRTLTVTLGALLMTAGHFCMAFDQSFLLAMLLLILGAGCLRGNLSPQFGDLYAKDDPRRDVAFQMYGAAVNLGAFIAPLATGALGAAFGWHVGFAFAGFGMLIGLVVYRSGARYLPPDRSKAPAGERRPLTQRERRKVLLLLAIVPVGALFWIAQSQVWNTYNLWARDHVDLKFGAWTMPVVWLQSLDGLSPFICLPPMLWFWRWQARHGGEPGDFTKIAIGCLIFSAATLWLAAAQFVTDASGRTPLIWAVVFHLASNLGWLYFTPIVSALYSRNAPAPINATLMAMSSVSVFIGSLISGRLGGFYEQMAPSVFWSIHAGLVGAAGVIFLALGRWLRGEFGAPAAAAPVTA